MVNTKNHIINMTKKNEITEVKVVKINDLKTNPNNPRIIKDAKFKKLVKSIQEFPEMLNVRPIIANKDMVIIGGNMRHRAAKEAKLKEVPCIIVEEWNEEMQNEFMIKDNVSAGEFDWDELANDWDDSQLKEWGVIQWEIPEYNPNLIPEADRKVVTAKDVEKKEDELNGRMSEVSKDTELEVCCPDCGSVFYVKK